MKRRYWRAIGGDSTSRATCLVNFDNVPSQSGTPLGGAQVQIPDSQPPGVILPGRLHIAGPQSDNPNMNHIPRTSTERSQLTRPRRRRHLWVVPIEIFRAEIEW